MSSYVFGLQNIDKTKLSVVGGKGANLRELSRLEGIRVPDGFFISTEAFKRIIGETSSVNELLAELSLLKEVDYRDKIGKFSGEIRRIIEEIAVPEDMDEEIICHVHILGKNDCVFAATLHSAEAWLSCVFLGAIVLSNMSGVACLHL